MSLGRSSTRASLLAWCTATAAALGLLLLAPAQASSTVYKWVDASGTVHLSSAKPPPGVAYETISVGPSSRATGRTGGRSGSTSRSPPVTPAQAAQRSAVLSGLQNRECVIALEALDRLTSGTAPTNASEIRRLEQTAELNCSKDPARRREQEEMAAKLRVANSADCVEARDRLAKMLEPGASATRAQVQAQRDFVEGHCSAPVR